MSLQEDESITRRKFIAGISLVGLGLVAIGNFIKGNSLENQKAMGSIRGGEVKDPIHKVSVKDFGAVGDGVTDDTAAFMAYLAFVEEQAVNNPAKSEVGDANKRGRVKLYIPEGCFVITKAEALMRRTYDSKTMGLVIQGAGKGLTQIYYKNTVPGKYLLYNNDAWLGVTISDIEFVSGHSNNNFMYSLSKGGAQNYTFERCQWDGNWNTTFQLEGSNNNSEMTWFHCNWSGTVNKGVYVPKTNSSDQFLNYNFYACQFEVDSGDFIAFENGGNINVWGGSFIHSGNKGGTFFGLHGNSHAYGVQRFLCIGARFEHRSGNSKLIDCTWNSGAVSMINIDTSSSADYLNPSAVIAAFASTNSLMPNIKFDNCMLIGKHQYAYNINSWNTTHNVSYENCEFSQALEPSDFVMFNSISGNSGGQPVIKFRNCRSTKADYKTAFFDSDFGYGQSNRAIISKKTITIKSAGGNFPKNGGSEDFYLPMNAIITSITFFCPPGAVTSLAAANYTIMTFEKAPTLLSTVNSIPASAGFSNQTAMMFLCDTDQKRHLKLLAGAEVDQSNSGACCFIEYLG